MTKVGQIPTFLLLMAFVILLGSCAAKRGRPCRCPQWSLEMPSPANETKDVYAIEV